MMYYADHHGFPIITFIDTPGAFADLKSEELGQVSKTPDVSCNLHYALPDLCNDVFALYISRVKQLLTI